MKLSALPLVATALVAVAAQAQPDPFVRPLPPAAAGTEAVGRFLHDLGYAPKALSPDVYQVTVERDRWPVHVMLSLSTDGRRVWLESKFAPIEDPDKVPPQAWKRLLEANEKVGPAHFAFDKTDKRIHLYKSFDNVGLSAARLKAELEHFDLTVRKTKDYWRADNFKPVIASSDPVPPVQMTIMPRPEPVPGPLGAPPGAGLPEMVDPDDHARMMGEWQVTEIKAKGNKVQDGGVTERKPAIVFRAARDGDPGPGLKNKLIADVRAGLDSTRTVWVSFHPVLPTKQIDFVDDRDQIERGIYKLDGDTLTLCFAAPGEPRPTEFKSTEQSKATLLVLRKAK